MKILAWIIFTPILLIIFGFAFCEANKAYWDHQVKLMCEKDGGVTVFEKVKLTKEQRKYIRIRNIKHATENDNYYSEFRSETLRTRNPEFLKTEYWLYRTSDKKLIGKQINYARVGGDFPTGISHPSSYSCNQVGITTAIEKAVFIIKGE